MMRPDAGGECIEFANENKPSIQPNRFKQIAKRFQVKFNQWYVQLLKQFLFILCNFKIYDLVQNKCSIYKNNSNFFQCYKYQSLIPKLYFSISNINFHFFFFQFRYRFSFLRFRFRFRILVLNLFVIGFG